MPRRRTVRVAGLLALSALAAAPLAAPRAAPGVGEAAALSCPGPERLLHPHLTWRHHPLAPGVKLGETVARDRRGRVGIHVLGVNLGRSGVSVAPLRRSLTGRHRLSALSDRRHLVAATNAMFFNFRYGAPTVPFISGRRALVLSRVPQRVAGIGSDGAAQDGSVRLSGRAVSGGESLPLAAVNEVAPPAGLSLYDRSWGHADVPLPPRALSRVLRRGHVASPVGRRRVVPVNRELLVARSPTSRHWLRSLAGGAAVSISRRVTTDAPSPFRQAYGVGTQLIKHAWQPLSKLYCRAHAILVARTAIGWTAGGRYLVLVVVENRRRPGWHGLDEDQMSMLLAAMGVDRAFALDGGGSSEMLARLGRRHHLAMVNQPSDGGERAIPVGIGVFHG